MSFGKTLAWVGFGFFAFIFVSKGGSDDVKRVSVTEKYNLSAVEGKAYSACKRQMSGRKLSVEGRGSVWPVPEQICVCQSKNMVEIFSEGKYGSHANVVQLLSEEPGSMTLHQMDLISPENPEAKFVSLVQSLVVCVDDYQKSQTILLEERIVENQDICQSSNKTIDEVCDRLRKQGRI